MSHHIKLWFHGNELLSYICKYGYVEVVKTDRIGTLIVTKLLPEPQIHFSLFFNNKLFSGEKNLLHIFMQLHQLNLLCVVKCLHKLL